MAGVLDDSQVTLLNAIVERLIPSDERSPGAREAHATRYILRALAAEYRRFLVDYAAGLDSVDSLARSTCGAPFVALDAAGQDPVLMQAERRLTFFDLVLKHTREGVFGDPHWGGNADRVGWQLIGYRGPQPTWSADDQRVEVIEPPLQSAP